MRFVRAFAPAVVVLALLSACAGAPTSATAPTTSAPAPTPVPTIVAPEPSSIVIYADRVEVVLDDGTVDFSFDYFEDAENVVLALTDVFDSEPVLDSSEPETPSDARATISYDWDGFRYYEVTSPQPDWFPDHFVNATTSTSHGIAVTTPGGIVVGDEMAPVEAEFPQGATSTTNHDGTSMRFVSVHEMGVTGLPDAPDGKGKLISEVISFGSDLVTTIHAPNTNFGL